MTDKVFKGKTSFKPLYDRVVVAVDAVGEQASPDSLIILPDTAKDAPQTGTVVAVGGGLFLQSGERVTPTVTPGNRVLFGRFAGADVEIDGVSFRILREEEIFGVISAD